MHDKVTFKDQTDIMKILGLTADDFVTEIHIYPHKVHVVTERVVADNGFANIEREQTIVKVER